MQCASPVLLKNGLVVACGKCYACRRTKSLEWAVRLSLERQYWTDACFVTLTYDDEHLGSPSLTYEDARNFVKYLRNNLDYPIKYLISGEYGGRTFRKHWHAIIFGLGYSDCRFTASGPVIPAITAAWQGRGSIMIGSAESGSLSYVSGYCLKKYGTQSMADRAYLSQVGIELPRRYFSRGLGASWLDDHRAEILRTKQTKVTLQLGSGPVTVPIPRYYVNRLVGRYRECLALEEDYYSRGDGFAFRYTDEARYMESHPDEGAYLEELEYQAYIYRRSQADSWRARFGDSWYHRYMDSIRAKNYIKEQEKRNYDNESV